MGNALDVVVSPQWTAIYRHPEYPTREVVLNSQEKPLPAKEFHVPMEGAIEFTAVSVTQLNKPKEGFKMAKKRSKKKKKDEEELEELEGLDELDDDDDDDDEEDEPDEVEEEDDEDEEDEDDDEEDEDEEEEKPKKKRSKKSKSKKSKSKGKKKKSSTPTPRELPKGKLSAQDVAELADTDARAVRLFLRKKANKKKFPKDKELGRYAFTKTQAKEIAKAMAKDED